MNTAPDKNHLELLFLNNFWCTFYRLFASLKAFAVFSDITFFKCNIFIIPSCLFWFQTKGCMLKSFKCSENNVDSIFSHSSLKMQIHCKTLNLSLEFVPLQSHVEIHVIINKIILLCKFHTDEGIFSITFVMFMLYGKHNQINVLIKTLHFILKSTNFIFLYICIVFRIAFKTYFIINVVYSLTYIHVYINFISTNSP